MGKAFGLLAMLVSMYIGMEIYQKGMNHALGGALAFMGEEEPVGGERVSVQKRAGLAVEAAHAAGEDRRNSMLDQLDE